VQILDIVLVISTTSDNSRYEHLIISFILFCNGLFGLQRSDYVASFMARSIICHHYQTVTKLCRLLTLSALTCLSHLNDRPWFLVAVCLSFIVNLGRGGSGVDFAFCRLVGRLQSRILNT
jgi:hypothetical protein